VERKWRWWVQEQNDLPILSATLSNHDSSSFSGDLKPELKQKAGLNTPKSNREAPSGTNIAPGSDDEETDNEADLVELLDQSASASEQEEGKTEKGNESEKQSEGDDIVAFISNKFENSFSITPRRDASGIMQGYFVQDEIRDPDDGDVFRKRVCVFSLLTSGVNVNLVEAARPGLGKTVFFNAHLSKKSALAKDLLGAIGDRDSSMVAGLQGVLDSKLRDSNDAAFRGIPWRVTVELPGDMDLEKHFVDPETNKYTNDPVFPNRLPSDDPHVESDTFFIACFILVRKPESGVVVRGERDRTSRMAYATPPSTRRTSHDNPRHSAGSSQRRIHRSGGRAASQRRPSREDYRYDQDNEEDMDVEYDSYETLPEQRPRQRRPTLVRHPSNNATNRNSGRSTRTTGTEEVFHDARSNRVRRGRGARTSEEFTNSGGRNRRGRENPDHPLSPRRRRQLNDRTVIEESEEINLSFETDDEESVHLQTVSSVEDSNESLYRYE
jgi:hypothetical protein